MTEAILEPDLPIIDPHHHLWDLRALIPAFPEPRHRFLETLVPTAHYTFDQFLADTQTGHNIIGTVFMECGAFYDAALPPFLRRTLQRAMDALKVFAIRALGMLIPKCLAHPSMPRQSCIATPHSAQGSNIWVRWA